MRSDESELATTDRSKATLVGGCASLTERPVRSLDSLYLTLGPDAMEAVQLPVRY